MSSRSKSNLVKKIYRDVGNPAGYTNPRRVWLEARKVDSGITLGQVKSVLSSIPAYTLHRRVRRAVFTRKYLSPGLNHYFQMDLFVLNEKTSRANRCKYLLFTLDVFSRKLFVRALKTKSGEEVASAIKSIIRENNSVPPLKVLTDRGREFLNRHVNDLLNTFGTVHFTSENIYHSALVERVIRTLREKFGRYMTDNKTDVFVTKLQDFVSAYNRTPHAALPHKMCPDDVNPRNELKVWKHQFAPHFRRAPGYYGRPKFSVGQVVRISKFQGKFKKSSDTSFTEELFVITHVLETKPWTYKIAALKDGDPVIGAFYSSELQLVSQE